MRYNKTNSYWHYLWLLKVIPLSWKYSPRPSASRNISNYGEVIFNCHLNISNYLYNELPIQACRLSVVRGSDQLCSAYVYGDVVTAWRVSWLVAAHWTISEQCRRLWCWHQLYCAAVSEAHQISCFWSVYLPYCTVVNILLLLSYGCAINLHSAVFGSIV